MSVPSSDSKRGAIRTVSAEDVDPHPRINLIRDAVGRWRASGWPGVSRITRELLEYWSGSDQEPQPFFCQREAVETLVWLVEAGPKLGQPDFSRVRENLEEINRTRNQGIGRLAVKMATGTGKTRVMAMLMLWQTFLRNKRADFLIIVPNLTVKERLSELDPARGTQLYRELLPPNRPLPTGRMRVTVLNYQAFQRRHTLAVDGPDDLASGTGRLWLRGHRKEDPEKGVETPEEMLNRLLRTHRNAKEIIVLNDEAHHCYAPGESPKRRVDRDTKDFEQAAALWFSGMKMLKDAGRLGHVFDLSATPMYIRRPADLGYELFPWTVSDYPLIDAIEAGLTKIPRVPVSDDTSWEEPVYRNVYEHTTPKRLQADSMPSGVTSLLEAMHDDYKQLSRQYADVDGSITPVMIVVANNIDNANAFYRHIAGHQDEDGHWHPGAYAAFSNVRADGSGPVAKPPTMLTHSGLDDVSSTGAADRVTTMQREFHSAGEDASKQEQREHIRKMFNTVGRNGQPGEHIKCIVSVSMLTEGWDVRTVTHIFGFRAFTSQLLCEQVAGRALRRTGFPAADGNLLKPEYARIFGVPFSFMAGVDRPPPPPVQRWWVETVEGRSELRLTFPNVVAYTLEPPEARVRLDPTKVRPYCARPEKVPGETTSAGVVGEIVTDIALGRRRNRILYEIARNAMKCLEAKGGSPRRRILFASMLVAVREWLDHPDVKVPNPAFLTHSPHAESVPQAIASACMDVEGGARIKPVFADQQDPTLPRSIDTSGVSFQTALNIHFPDDPQRITARSELNRAACHSEPERLLALTLDIHHGVEAWARNYKLGWRIPYFDRDKGVWRSYEPDFLARVKNGDKEPCHVVIEFKGLTDDNASLKADAVENWWLPAVHGSSDPSCMGRWKYLVITDRGEIEAELDRILTEEA